MEAIFGAAAPSPPPPRMAPRTLPMARATPPRRRSRAPWLALFALVAIAVLAGSWIWSAQLVDPVVAKPARTAAPRPPILASSPATPAVEDVAAAAPVLASEDRREVAPDEHSAPAYAPPRAPVVAAAVPVRAAPAAVERRSAGGCDRLDDDEAARCYAPQLQRADRALVAAYAEAAEAGLPRDFLVDVRRRWVRARDAADQDPGYAIGRYRALADELRNFDRDQDDRYRDDE